jgi:error-prone DNA polymerase
MERFVLAGAFDELHHISSSSRQRRGGTSRRDLLVHIAELERWRSGGGNREAMLFDAGPGAIPLSTGLPEMDATERVQAELEILGMEVSHHVMDFHEPLMAALGVTRSRDLLNCRSRQEVLIAGVKVATQTPPVRSGKRVIFLTLDDATGPLDAAFFEDAQGPFAHTLFHSWTLLVRGVIRRTGPRGISIRATGCWDLRAVQDIFDAASHTSSGLDVAAGHQAVMEFMESTSEFEDFDELGTEEAAASRSTRPVMSRRRAGGMGGGQRVLVHPSGFRQSPWADIAPAGGIAPPTKLWHTSPGSPG